MDNLSVKYQDIKISYWESEDTWKFHLRGRDRSAESLAKAKEFIDKPVKEKAAVFEKIKAYAWDYSAGFARGEITSIAEDRGWRNKQVWFTNDTGGRSRLEAYNVYPATAENVALIIEAETARTQERALAKKQTELRGRMVPYIVKEEV